MEANKLKNDGEIEDFEISHNRRHYVIRFKAKGQWSTVPFASSPRTEFVANFTRQQIRRRIRSLHA
ncbi:hypothetical protein [Bradyrhizobium sp. SZCCHNR3118]|uniref:hypothetical protein n=1 Tax=Bradyrhizobium sp. SZCCHNR3118 TaxID=3057468 RepID=UPI0029164006|nr:hypothetical protein [Bradyrhizobium sp. SZCCHNR3118]